VSVVLVVVVVVVVVVILSLLPLVASELFRSQCNNSEHSLLTDVAVSVFKGISVGCFRLTASICTQ
jgi:hypothetical protein